MPVFKYNQRMDKAQYYKVMAELHKLNPKLFVIRTLYEKFNQIKSTSTIPGKEEERKWEMAYLANQIFALTLELTEDLAAACSAFQKCISSPDDTKYMSM